MSFSSKYLCVNGSDVYQIPLKQINNNRIEKEELRNLTSLMVTVLYELKDKKPYEVRNVWFERITFNEKGVHEILLNSPKISTQMTYAFHGFMGNDDKELPVPVALVEPTQQELEALKKHLNNKYPLLLKRNPYAIEMELMEQKSKHEKDVKLFKETHNKV